MKKTISALLVLSLSGLFFGACQGENTHTSEENNKTSETTQYKIISLNGTLTEILFALDLGGNVIGTDVTSTYPAETANLPKVGHISSVQAEGIIALGASHVLTEKGALKKDLLEQLQNVGIVVVEFDRDISVEGTKQLIANVAKYFDKAVPSPMIASIDESLSRVTSIAPAPTVLFIYGRSAGNLMVAGENTPLEKMISLSGAVNAVAGFEDFKPLSNEVLVAANPDYILMFDSAPGSLNGMEGILEIPGIKETTAGRKNQFIFLDGQLISGFGPRVGQAAQILNSKYQTSND
jgi:iron complex transport system substrate-binding protein